MDILDNLWIFWIFYGYPWISSSRIALGTAVSTRKIGATVVAYSINRLEFHSPKIVRYPLHV
jgi:hypothetical protein